MRDIYLDNHATTRVDPRVVEAMLPWFTDRFANPGSTTHEAGRLAKEAVEIALASIANYFEAEADELIVTSGATESNNLAIFGVANHPRQKRRKIISVATEHQATLGPLAKLKNQGFEIVLLPVQQHTATTSSDPSTEQDQAGLIDLQQLEDSIDETTALVTVMLANNEIGVLQPMQRIAEMCRRFEVPLHTDATQAVGRVKTSLSELGVNLLSFSAHKFYGPKGIGGLIVRNTSTTTRVSSQIVGGGQQHNLRSGTLNSPGIIAMAAAIECLRSDAAKDHAHGLRLRQRLWDRLRAAIPDLELNGPHWPSDASDPANGIRLANNLNVCFPKVDGQSLMLEIPCLAVSSGSACTSAHPEPSHVLRAIGRSEDQARSSIRFGIGRFNTEPEIDEAVNLLVETYTKLASFVA